MARTARTRRPASPAAAENLTMGQLVRYSGSDTANHGVYRVQVASIESGAYAGRTLLVDPEDERHTLIPSAGNASLQLHDA
jgi:hypothetical protein